MSTLIRKTPFSEYLEGFLFKVDKETGDFGEGIRFMYRNYLDDENAEVQLIKGMQVDKVSNKIYTSDPISFDGGDEVDLEDQEFKRKVKLQRFDQKKSKRNDLRLKGVKDKHLFVGKIITLE